MTIKHIIELLKKDGEVYINGLGLFKTVFHEATTEGDQLIPPHNEVVLQEDATGNGSALVMEIANQKKIDVTAADEEVRKWVSNLKKRIQKSNTVAIASFGTFTDEDDKISFTSADIPYLNTEFEGMEPVAEKKRGRKKKITVAEISTAEVFSKEEKGIADRGTIGAIETIEEEAAAAEPVEPIAEPIAVIEEEHEEIVNEEPLADVPEPVVEKEVIVEEPVEEETKEEDIQLEPDTIVEKPKEPKFRGVFLLLTLIIIGLLVAGYLYRDKIMAMYHQWRDSKAVITDTIPTTPIEPIAEDTTLVVEDTNFVDTLVTTVTAVAEPQAVAAQPTMPTYTNGEIPEVTFEAGKYYVIAGSFITTGEAKSHIKQRHLESYNPVILRQNGSQRIRVCIGIFTNESEAQAFATSANSKYWVLK